MYLTLAVGIALAPAGASGAPLNPLSARIAAIVQDPALRFSRIGIKVVSLDTGRTIYEREPNKMFSLASVGKIFSTGGALALVGPDYRYHTYVYRDGAIANGTLHGDVILRAAGDPNLSGRIHGDTLVYQNIDRAEAALGGRPPAGDPYLVMNEFAKQIAARGIRRVTGRVIVDASLYPEGYVEFGSGVITSPVSFNDNWVDVWITPGKTKGAPASVKSAPQTGYANFTSAVKTAAAGSAPAVGFAARRRDDATYDVTVEGSVPMGAPVFRVWAAPSPSLYAAIALNEALRRGGVNVALSPRNATTAEPPLSAAYRVTNILALHASPPLREDVKVILKVSQNLHAWMTPFTIGIAAGHAKSDQDAAGFALIQKWLQKNKIDTAQLSLQDGAGSNAFGTPNVLANYLAMMSRQPYFRWFHDALPVMGKNGSLAGELPSAPVAGHYSAKTGTAVSSDLLNQRVMVWGATLAGYMTNARGHRLIVVILSGNTPLPAVTKPILDQEADIANAIYTLSP